MKISLVLDADSPEFLRNANEILTFLHASKIEDVAYSFWLFYQHSQPRELPLLDLSPTDIVWFPVASCMPMEVYVARLELAFSTHRPDAIVFCSGGWGDELATRLGRRLQGSTLTGVQLMSLSLFGCEARKTVYEQRLEAVFSLPCAPYCLSVTRSGGGNAQVAMCDNLVQTEISDGDSHFDWLISIEVEQYFDSSPLNDAPILLAIGQGVGSCDGVRKMQWVAEQLGAQLGESRPVVMNAWGDMSRLIGISGAIVAPEICIAAGVSGAAAFTAGISRSLKIVAINSDPQAAIFAHADVAIVDDMHQVLAALVQCVKADSR